MHPLVYLASPYTHADADVRKRRYEAACREAARLMLAGHTVFCPVAHSHPIAEQMPDGNAVDGELWKRQDAPYLQFCSAMVVVKMPGWEQSSGIKHEIERAIAREIPITYVSPAHHEMCGDPMGCHPDCIYMTP